MKLFGPVILFLLSIGLFFLLGILYFVYKIVNRVRKTIIGDIDDEEAFQRMADKHYHRKNDPQFDKDYFKSKQSDTTGTSGSGTYSGHQQAPRTTTTAEGVTIIDERSMHDSQHKIFADDEGEYVDFVEEK